MKLNRILNESAAKITEGLVKEVADTWYRPDGSPKTRAMTQSMIVQTMKDYQLPLREAAEVIEQAMLLYKGEHVSGGRTAYWELVDKMAKTQILPGDPRYPKDL